MGTSRTGQFERDPAKAKSREFMRKSIISKFPSEGQRRSLRTMFLTGPSLVEHDQIYAPVGIDPKNVFGVERDPEAFRRAKEQNDARPEAERINLLQGEAATLFDGKQRYDIISLDFLQNYGPDVTRLLDAVFEPDRPSIGNDAILFINIQARREQSKYIWRLAVFNMLAYSMAAKDYFVREKEVLAAGIAGKFDSKKEKERMAEVALRAYEFLIARASSDKFQMLQGRELLETPSKGLETLRAVDLVSWTRSGLFAEVFIRAQYAALRSLSLTELLDVINNGSHDEEMNAKKRQLLCTYAVNAFPMIDLDVARDVESLKETMLFAAIGQACIGDLHTALCLRCAREFGIRESKMHRNLLMLAGDSINLLRSISVQSHETFGYTSESHTPMLLNSFALENVFEKMGLSQEDIVMGALAMAEYRLYWLNMLTSKTTKSASFRAAWMARYKNGRFMDDMFDDYKIWRKYREGVRLFNMLRRFAETVGYFGEIRRNLNRLTDTYYEILSEKLRVNLPQMIEIQKQLGVASEPPSHKAKSKSEAPEPKTAVPRAGLTPEDKAAIRELSKEGYSPQSIHEILFTGTIVTRAQISAVCAWNKIYEKKAERAK